MTVDELKSIFIRIQKNFPGRLTTEQIRSTSEEWYRILKDYEYELVNKNLDIHLTSSSFLPTIADLVKQPKKDEQHRPYIPDVEETMKYIEEKREHEKNATSREKALKYLEEMRKVINADGH